MRSQPKLTSYDTTVTQAKISQFIGINWGRKTDTLLWMVKLILNSYLQNLDIVNYEKQIGKETENI